MIDIQDVYKILNSKESFSIVILLKSGQIRFVKNCICVGQKWNLKHKHMRALMPIDSDRNKIAHEIPFSVFKILKLNNRTVTL